MADRIPRSLPAAPTRSAAVAPQRPRQQPAQPQPPQPAQRTPAPAPAPYLSNAQATAPAPAPPAAQVYTPENPVFFHLAMTQLVGALLIPSGITDPDDEKNAFASAELVAKLLDRGVVPDNYITTENLAATTQALYFEHKQLDGTPVRGSSEGEKAARYEQYQKHMEMATKQKHFAPPKSVEEIRASNARTVAMLQDVSEPVRFAALSSIILRLTGLGKSITGFHRNEVLSIAVRELLRSIQFADLYGVPARGLETIEQMKLDGAIDDETAARVCPYPASVALSVVTALLEDARLQDEAIQEELEGEQAQHAEGDEGEPT